MSGNKASGNKSDRTRNWGFILYPESTLETWHDYLDELHIEWIESPLHEFDADATGEAKKAHYHILLMFGGLKTYDQVCDILKPLNCPAPQKCLSVKGFVRYMAHLDNPDKFQYKPSDIIGHGGVDVLELLKPSAAQRYTQISEMCDYIQDNQITEFQDLFDFARRERFDSWFPLLCDSHAYILGQYIKSQRHRTIVPKDN